MTDKAYTQADIDAAVEAELDAIVEYVCQMMDEGMPATRAFIGVALKMHREQAN
mgnify:CR=1 FL=1